MPRIAFEDPLPIGMESLEEKLFLTVRPSVSCRDLSAKLNSLLPPGITISACERLTVKPASVRAIHVTYRMTLEGATFDPLKLQAFEQAAEYKVQRTGRKRKNAYIDLKQVVISTSLKDRHILEMTTTTEPGKMLRPHEISAAIFDLPEDILKLARIVKQPEVKAG
jgi:radical SAM-linked protein